MNITISEDQQNKVGLQFFSFHCKIHEDVKNTRKECRSSHLDILQVFSVSIYNALDAIHLRLLKASIQWEAMVHLSLTEELWDASKPEDWELLVVIVGLQDITHLDDSLLVLIRDGPWEVKRLRIGNLTITSREIDSTRQTHLPPRPQVLCEVRIL